MNSFFYIWNVISFQKSVLQKIGGDGRVDGKKMLEELVNSIITPKMLSNITWSGRAGKGKDKKIALQKYKNIVALMTSLTGEFAAKYTTVQCLKDLKYKILKYAYDKHQEEIAASDSDTIS